MAEIMQHITGGPTGVDSPYMSSNEGKQHDSRKPSNFSVYMLQQLQAEAQSDIELNFDAESALIGLRDKSYSFADASESEIFDRDYYEGEGGQEDELGEMINQLGKEEMERLTSIMQSD